MEDTYVVMTQMMECFMIYIMSCVDVITTAYHYIDGMMNSIMDYMDGNNIVTSI